MRLRDLGTSLAIIALTLAVIAAVLGGWVWMRAQPPVAGAIGGPFVLADQFGRRTTDRDLVGRPSLLFFGYTHCPEVCPTTLTRIANWLGKLGPDSDRLNVVFISVDPARDTPAVLKAYLGSFDPRIRGLTGPDAAIRKAADAYRVYYAKVPLKGGEYEMDHTSLIYMLDARGRYVGVIAYGENDASAMAKIRELMAKQRSAFVL